MKLQTAIGFIGTLLTTHAFTGSGPYPNHYVTAPGLSTLRGQQNRRQETKLNSFGHANSFDPFKPPFSCRNGSPAQRGPNRAKTGQTGATLFSIGQVHSSAARGYSHRITARGYSNGGSYVERGSPFNTTAHSWQSPESNSFHNFNTHVDIPQRKRPFGKGRRTPYVSVNPTHTSTTSSRNNHKRPKAYSRASSSNSYQQPKSTYTAQRNTKYKRATSQNRYNKYVTLDPNNGANYGAGPSKEPYVTDPFINVDPTDPDQTTYPRTNGQSNPKAYKKTTGGTKKVYNPPPTDFVDAIVVEDEPDARSEATFKTFYNIAASMKVTELRKGLEAMGISTDSFIEKAEFVNAYTAAKANLHAHCEEPVKMPKSFFDIAKEQAISMSFFDLRKELDEMGIPTGSIFEKDEYIRVYAEAKAKEISKRYDETNGDYDPSYRDVNVEKCDWKSKLGDAIDQELPDDEDYDDE